MILAEENHFETNYVIVIHIQSKNNSGLLIQV